MRSTILYLMGLLSTSVLGTKVLLADADDGGPQYLGLLMDGTGGWPVLVPNVTGYGGNLLASKVHITEGTLILKSNYKGTYRTEQVAVKNNSDVVLADDTLNPPTPHFDFTSNGTLVYGNDSVTHGFRSCNKDGSSPYDYVYWVPTSTPLHNHCSYVTFRLVPAWK